MEIESVLKEALIQRVRRLFDLKEIPEVQIEKPKQKAHGDFTTNLALVLAPSVKMPAREVAGALIKGLALPPQISQAAVAGPGFINFTLTPDYYRHILRQILILKEKYGHKEETGPKTLVEFVSANPTGPLTIGHGRQAVLGDTIARLLEAMGHQVTREYYFNNAGRQMRILGDSVRLRALELLGEPIAFPEEYYQGEYIRDIARKALSKKGETLKTLPEPEAIDFCRELAEKEIFAQIRETLDRLRIRFDVYYNETSLYETGKVEAIIRALKEKGFAYEKDGALWFRTTQFGMAQDRVIVKSTGEPTYRLPDIAYHKDKLDRGFDWVIDLFGADHVATYPDVLAGLQALGYDPSRIRVLIHQFVTLSEGKAKIKMSTRKANFVTLDELMDEVGVDVTRYFFLNRSMSSHLNFDLTLAKTQSEENPVYYVQYAHARISSILRKAAEAGYDLSADADLSLLTTEEEMDLLRLLEAFPSVVAESAEQLEPHRIPGYLEELATAYHRFQHVGKEDESRRVLTDDRRMTLARLALCQATRIVLANGLDLLGISAPERM